MNPDKGIYALVMPLDAEQSIAIGRNGTGHVFPRGWYVYVGSARGPGGLQSRTDQHRRCQADGKRMHWNVDWFREFASIREIWYSRTDASCREHDWAEHGWAKMLHKLPGATIPVQGFGAKDCDAGCEAHFFRFPRRPYTAELRSCLMRTNPRHPEVFAEQIDDCGSTDRPRRDSLLGQYECGRHFLERRRLAIAADSSDPGEWKSFARNRPARLLMDQVAAELGLDVADLKADVEFAEAVETIAGNCEEDVFGVVFDAARPQNRKAVLQLSRTANTRQQYRIEQVLKGRCRSIAPQNDDPVFDTVSFAEVISRLRRARGAIRIGLDALPEGGGSELAEECGRLTDLCQRSANQLMKFVNRRKSGPLRVLGPLTREAVMPVLKNRAVRGRIVGRFRLALKLTIKSLWDYPEMERRGIQPSRDEKRWSSEELQWIICLLITGNPLHFRKE